jgi:hypothetical protein
MLERFESGSMTACPIEGDEAAVGNSNPVL